jgi:hypothetical protein
LADDDPESEAGAVVAVVDEGAPLRVVAVVEEESESESAPVSSAGALSGDPPSDESPASAIVVVVDFSGPDSAAHSDGCPPTTGANASRTTTPAASGNRNRRCMPAS